MDNLFLVSSWMGDPMVSGCHAHGHGSEFFAFFFTQNLLLMFLKILVPNFCVSMETCCIGIEKTMFLNYSRTEHS